MGDPSETVPAANGTANNSQGEDSRAVPIGAIGPPPWAGWTDPKSKPVLSARQRMPGQLNPSFQWLKIVQSGKVSLGARAINVAAALYDKSPPEATPFAVGQRHLADKLARGKQFVSQGIADLVDAGFLIVHKPAEDWMRDSYQLAVPVEAPGGLTSDPRRTGGVSDDPRRTGRGGMPSDPPRYAHQPTPGSPSNPRRTREPLKELPAVAAARTSDDLPVCNTCDGAHVIEVEADHYEQCPDCIPKQRRRRRAS